MSATTPPPPDSGTQPAPHYCRAARASADQATGCPGWPACVPQPAAPPSRTLGESLAGLLGIFAGLGLAVAVVTLLRPLFP